MAVSLLIFAVLFFTVIQPSTNTANQAIKTGEQQAQQAISQAQKQLSSATGQASAASGQASAASGQASGVPAQAQQQLSKAAKLSACVTSAGTDVGKIQACQAKYQQ
jgi:hypothetical protein